jgi:transcriptional regulator with XRE-family HTH domain
MLTPEQRGREHHARNKMASRLRDTLTSRNLTYKELAAAMGISASTIARGIHSPARQSQEWWQTACDVAAKLERQL